MAEGENDTPQQRSAPRSQRTRQQQNPTQQQQRDDEPSQLTSILNWVLVFFAMQNVVGFMVAKFMPQDENVVPSTPPLTNDNVQTVPLDSSSSTVDIEKKKTKPVGVTNNNKIPGNYNNNKIMKMKPACLWQQGTVMDLELIITDSSTIPSGWPELTTPDINNGELIATESSSKKSKSKESIILGTWSQEGLVLGGESYDGKPDTRHSIMTLLSSNTNQTMNYRNTTLTIPLTKSIWNNETHVYAYVKLQRRRKYPPGNNKKRIVRNDDVLVKRMLLTRHRKRKKNRDVKSLLDTSDKTVDLVEETDDSVLTKASLNKTHEQLLLYIKPSLTLQIVDFGKLDFASKQAIPTGFANHMDWYTGEEGRGPPAHQDLYYPILYQSEFWITFASLKEVNGTMKESELNIAYEPVSMWKWQLQSQTEDNWRKQEAFTGEEDEGNDMLRNMLLDTNPYLLAVTAIVSMLHTVFDVLAFKNDISFFKNKKSMEGLSLRSMIVNAGFSAVILLYLADNDTSYMVLMSNGVGLAIDVWKISKAITVNFDGGTIQWVEASSYKKSKTKEYDEIATSHLLFVTMPLVAGYGMYSLLYQKHKGWYSWILNTLVGFIYMFGFVMMTPQLFINYKLQSVAHLNWRTMSYKSINTFIDDLFAFVIKMPIMHRLACLRDDLIFFIYLFQRYKYKTDFSRVNEYGQCEQPTEEMLAEQAREKEEESAIATGVQEQTTVRKRRGARDK